MTEAIEEYRLAAKIDPASAIWRTYIGHTFMTETRFAEAEQEYRWAVRLSPNDPKRHQDLAFALFHQQKLNEAVEELRLAVKLNPRDARMRANLGGMLANLGKESEAIEVCREGVRLNADSTALNAARTPPAAAGIAVLGGANIVLGTSKVDVDGFAMLHNNLALLLANATDPKLREPTEAVQLAERAVKVEPNRSDYWNTLGQAQYRAGDYKVAVETLTKAMELRSGGNPWDWFVLALAHWQLKNQHEARTWYDKGVAGIEKEKPDQELLRVQAEAAELLGIPLKPPEGKETPDKPKS